MRQAFPALLLMAGLAVHAARAATLRPFGILDRPTVRLGDLFDGIGAAGRRVLGPGPAPGGRIVVPAAQLAAIAEEFGVDWHPRSPEDQVILERPGRPLRRGEVAGPLRAALAAAGAPVGFRLVQPNFSPPEVPPGAAVETRVQALDYDPTSGQFSAVLAVSANGMDAVDVPVSGRAERTLRVLVAARLLAAGAVILPSDLQAADILASRVELAVATRADQASGMELRRAVAAGEPIPLADLTHPPLVRRGQKVMIALAVPGLELSEQGQALGSGSEGDSIRVLNPRSHAMLEATVTGPGTVSVIAGSLPLAPPTDGARFGYPRYAAQ